MILWKKKRIYRSPLLDEHTFIVVLYDQDWCGVNYTHMNHSQKLQREYTHNLVENIGSEENTICYKLQIKPTNTGNDWWPVYSTGLCLAIYYKCCWKLNKLKSVLHHHFEIL